MSYVPSHLTGSDLAQPNALTVIEHTASTTQTATVGNRINLGSTYNWYGSFSPTIASDQITLPSGYYYYVESAIQAYNASFTANMHLSTQHYDETNTASIGTEATIFQISYNDASTFSRDGCARALIDCTGGSIDISLKLTAVNTFNRVNYNAGYYLYGGLGRTVIWQLNT